ncbi:MAG: DUF447 family protein [Candidatus Aramenus sp.]|nr:DUF447 family protein [Candidatus Aramenus sp.]
MAQEINDIFPGEGVFEVILGTNGVKPNLSPIGVIKKGEELTSKIYRETLTYSNIMKLALCTIHVTDDPRIFYSALMKNLEFAILEGLPVLSSGVYSIIRAKCEYTEGNNPATFRLIPISVQELGKRKKAFSRGHSLFIDAMVHFTRLEILPKEEVKELLEVLSYELKTCKRISPDIQDLVEDLEKRIASKGFKLA